MNCGFRPIGRAALGVLGGLILVTSTGCPGGGGGEPPPPPPAAVTFDRPTKSGTIAITSDDRVVIVPNIDADTVSIIEVRDGNGNDVSNKLAEVDVGDEPRYVAIAPNDGECYVSNTAGGTVSVVLLGGQNPFRVFQDVEVGSEPRGIAVTPNGTRLYVANHTEGTVSVIDVETLNVIGTVAVGGNPEAVAITNDGDADDTDETVFVTQFYAELNPNGDGEVFDNGKQGVVRAFQVGNPGSPEKITLAPLANVGFTADRTPFCSQFNAMAANDTFCPDVNEFDPASATITMDPQGAYPNQLKSALIRGDQLFLPNIGAGPAPPVRFNVNIQALVNVVDVSDREEITGLAVNLNNLIKAETQPEPPAGSLDRLFGNDIVDIDANSNGTQFLIVSRGGNYVLRAGLDNDGVLDIGAPDNVVRFLTGNIPSGVVMSHDGTRAYTNNEVNSSVTSIDLETDNVIERDIDSSTPPNPGSDAHAVLAGKLVFFTALGTPNNGIFDIDIRDIEPLDERNKASDNGWSGCSSCHPDGLADGVTWSFGTGPRQTVPLDAFFAQNDAGDQRISNYSAIMGSTTDFNNNSRGVQGGIGFVDDPTIIFQHGITEGASDAHDAMTRWVQTIRSPIMPEPDDDAAVDRGRAIFADNCASCHGGAKWTKSEIIYDNNPTFTADVGAGGVLIDDRLTNAGPQIVDFTDNGQTLRFLENVGTFDPADELELRGAGATQGQASLGGLGFQPPSMLGIAYHAPFLHNGAAQTLDELFNLHGLGGGTIASELDAADRADLEAFINTIDDSTVTLPNETDDFLGR